MVGERLATNEQAPRYDGKYNRVQDKELLEIADQRCCMSMHQPYASLLVAGIKRHEGRTWYTSHRGRLWIAATAKPADPEEVRRVEEFYRKLHAAGHGGEEELQFPRVYPSGCLVGSVLVQNCLPREDYEREFPHGESESPYVFVCNGAEALPVRFPVKGEHKICELWNRGISVLANVMIILFYFPRRQTGRRHSLGRLQGRSEGSQAAGQRRGGSTQHSRPIKSRHSAQRSLNHRIYFLHLTILQVHM